MGRALAEAFPICRDTFAEADAALGEPLSTVIFDGPEDRLTLTENTQPAILSVTYGRTRPGSVPVIGWREVTGVRRKKIKKEKPHARSFVLAERVVQLSSAKDNDGRGCDHGRWPFLGVYLARRMARLKYA